MLERYLLGRQLLCRRCLSFIRPPAHQQRLQSLLLPPPRKQFSTALPRQWFPRTNHYQPQGSQEQQEEHRQCPENGESQTTADAAEQPIDLSHIPKNVKLRNEEIIPLNGEIRYIDENQKHHGIVKFADVVNSFDRGTYALICVNPSVVVQNEPPTCLLTPIAHLLERERREAQAAAEALLRRNKKPAISTKMLEFTWAISLNDLAHKMKKVGEFLRKGNRVEVVIGTRKGMAKVKADQANELVAKVRETGTEFGREWKEVDGALGTQLTLFFEGKAPVKAKGDEEEGGNVTKKKKKKKFMTPEELKAEEEAEAAAKREK